MEFGVLTSKDNFMFTAPEEMTIGKTGVSRIMIDLSAAVNWLKEDTTRQLIVILPLNQANRKVIASSLIVHQDRCIGLEPPDLLAGSSRVFLNSHDLQIGILGQIRALVQTKKDSN